MDISLQSHKRFQVALSFAGEFRSYVEAVAIELQRLLDPSAIFYDKFYVADLARPNLDTYLLRIYRDQSELIVVFLCESYAVKEWCGLEWRAVRDMIKTKQSADIMPFVFGDYDMSIEGFLSIDGYIRIGNLAPESTADLIARRLASRQAGIEGKSVVEIVLDQELDTFTDQEIEALAKLIREVVKDNRVKIFSKRRGSLIITLVINQDQRNALIAAANNGKLSETKLLEIRSAGEVLFGRLESTKKRSTENSLLRTHSQARGTIPWTVRYFTSNLLASLIRDLRAQERSGISQEQCGAVKECIHALANATRSIPTASTFSSPFYWEIEKFESIYGGWNDVRGESQDAQYIRMRQLLTLSASRQRVMRKAQIATREASVKASFHELEDSKQIFESAIWKFAELVNVGRGLFPALGLACEKYMTRSSSFQRTDFGNR